MSGLVKFTGFLSDFMVRALKRDVASLPLSAAPPDVSEDPNGPKKVSLEEIISLIQASDDAMLAFEVDLEQLGEQLRTKVDRTVGYIDYCRERSETLGRRAKDLADRAKAYKNRAEAAQDRVAYVMNRDALHQGIEPSDARGDRRFKYGGHEVEFVLYSSESCRPLVEPNAYLYRVLGEKLIKREYSWRLTELKALLAKGNPAAKRLAEIVKTPYVKIRPKS